MNSILAPNLSPPVPPKRMIEHEEVAGKHFVSINSSSLSVLLTCMRKSEYLLSRGLRRAEDSENEALRFGSAVHHALQAYYTLPLGERTAEQMETILHYFEEETMGLGHGESDSKRSSENGRKILEHYFETYRSDPWQVYFDAEGPMCERSFEFTLFDSDTLRVGYHGQVDAVMQNKETGEIAVFDHKTSSTLGKEFLKRWNPNHQLTGYVLGARRAWGIECSKAVVNGIQVAKTKSDLMRLEVDYQAYQFDQFKDAVLWGVRQFLIGKTHALWPMAGGTTCSEMGGCQYLEVCSAHPDSREQILKFQYPASFHPPLGDGSHGQTL